MHGTRRKTTLQTRTAKSAITNGSRLFAERVDLRTPRGKRFRDLINGYSAPFGTKITEADRAIIRDLAMLQVLSEDIQQQYMQSGEMKESEYAQYSRIVNAIRRHMKTLGLIDLKRESDPHDDDHGLDPLAYMQRGGTRRSHRVRLDGD
ncbi:hypothetical protein XI06_12650 [Bradyrhizobium sp. CCBAU 11434]|uniref:hypothetical protein n=1 Tax=Bradyrhizobium sp. CCBAU 11434 TaxID=1630885 RepID=UPI00230615AF|nr:hypothetical protein [Bradyrhizobium sp. CCBAU 11434]MDA9521207.1 hypothetical protein [Bradyrhizobium sp. CCBAU 11434]